MNKGQPKNKKKPTKRPLPKDTAIVQLMKVGTAVPERLTRELVLLKKVELKKVSGRILDFKFIKLSQIDDAGKFCIWLEIEDANNTRKKNKVLQLVPHVAPHALNKLTGYFEKAGEPAIVNVLQAQKIYLTLAPLQKNYTANIKSCTITYVRSTPLDDILSLKEIKKLRQP